jgi:hypothetical protein
LWLKANLRAFCEGNCLCGKMIGGFVLIELDIRWKQRFSNYQFALSRLDEGVTLARQRPLSDLEKQGLIQAFEFTHELAWNVMKDYFAYQGNPSIMGS